MTARADRWVGCEDNSLRPQSNRRKNYTHRLGPKAPPLRHLRAAAAIEREDRDGFPSAFHVVFPTTEVTKRVAARKSGTHFLTKDAAASVLAETRADSLPQRSSDRLTRYRDTAKFRFTCYRDASTVGATGKEPKRSEVGVGTFGGCRATRVSRTASSAATSGLGRPRPKKWVRNVDA